MEIELPDGTVLEAPDDADIKAVVRGYTRQQGIAKLKAENPAEYDTSSNQFRARYNAQGTQQVETPDMSASQQQAMLDMGLSPRQYAQRFGKMKKAEAVAPAQRAAIGSGMIRGWKGLTNLALPDSLTPDFASDENIKAMDERDAELPLAGKMVGSMAATAPISGALGMAQRGATALSTASQAPVWLTRALASAPTRAVLEGATQGAIYADPDKQGAGALQGAALSLAMNRIGATGGKLMRGLVEKSPEAEALHQLAAQHGDDLFIPISQAASDDGMVNSLTKTFYKEGLPVAPGVKGRLERQAAKASEKMREIALKDALPTGGTLPLEAGKKVSSAVDDIQRQFDDAYLSTVKSYAFNVPSDLEKQLHPLVQNSAGKLTQLNNTTTKEITDNVSALFRKFSNGKSSVDGTNLLNIKREISELVKMAKGHEKSGYKAADKFVDDLIESELKVGNIPQNLSDLLKYKDLTPAYRAFEPVKKAAQEAVSREGRFKFARLADFAKRSPEQKSLGQLGAAVLDKPAATSTKAGQILAGAGMLGTGVGAMMAPGMTAALVGGGHALASKGTQKFLMGDLRIQQYIAKLLREHPEFFRRAGSAVRTGVTSQAVE